MALYPNEMLFKKYDSDFAKVARDLSSIGSFGFLMAGSIFLGYFAGNYLDNFFGTSPWLLILFILLGITGGIMEYKKILKKVLKDKEQNENTGNS